jgi:hypothetical protein
MIEASLSGWAQGTLSEPPQAQGSCGMLQLKAATRTTGDQVMELQSQELLTAVLIGIGLSAACGFRVFVPLLGASIAAYTGYLPLASEFSWLGSPPALLALGLATCIEIGAYSVPLIDHVMDVVTTPAALVAGTLLMAAQLGDVSPFVRWSLAVIAGGGAAGLVQAGSVLARGGAATLSGGLGNLIVALLEFGGAVAMTLLAIFMPFLTALGLMVGLLLMIRFVRRRVSKSRLPLHDSPRRS